MSKPPRIHWDVWRNFFGTLATLALTFAAIVEVDHTVTFFKLLGALVLFALWDLIDEISRLRRTSERETRVEYR